MAKKSLPVLLFIPIMFIIGLAVRVIQITAGTDMTRGTLYYDNNFLMNYGYYILIAAAFFGALALSLFNKKNIDNVNAEDIRDWRAVIMGFALILLGACALYEGYEEMRAITPSPIVIFSDFLFGAVFIITAFIILYFKEFKPALGFSLSTSAVYFTIRGIAVFLDKMVIVGIPEYLIECVSVILSAAFFMLTARFLSGNSGKFTKFLLISSGTAGSILTLSSACAVIISGFAPGVSERIVSNSYSKELYYQIHKGIDAYTMAYVPWTDAAAALFMIAVIVAVTVGSPQNKSEEFEEVTVQ